MRRHEQEWHARDVAQRPWTRAERNVVLHGFFGRLIIAIEPLIASVFFAILPVAMLLRRQEVAAMLAPVFALAAVGFMVYAIVLIWPSARAVSETFAPIYTVDGYVRYRVGKSGQPEYYVAALNADREILCEWPLREWPHSIGERDTWPVLVEFSRYGGIHKIDGRPTGVLPAKIAALGIGVARGEAESRSSESR
jgi:hypothetical protein